MSLDIVQKYFSLTDLNILQKGNNPRFLDQKCTPDVISFIADCVIQLDKTSFDRNDIWNSQYFIKNASWMFGKPSPKNVSANSEYDKFILQPLDMFSYAGALEKTKYGNKNIFQVKQKEILEFIARNEKNAFLFLFTYLDKFTKDNNLDCILDSFLKKQDSISFDALKNNFIKFLLANSNIGTKKSATGGSTEIKRIFPKFLNILAVAHTTKGTEKGRLSKGNFLFYDLMYNRTNFRDIRKLKNITRKEEEQSKHSKPASYRSFQMQKAMKWIKQNHPYSEVNDRLKGNTEEVHHIFPKAKFPEISYYIENLIALTAGQHKSFAHPKGNSIKLDINYQKLCLKAKEKTISGELEKKTTQYSIHDFIFVLNIGFENKIPEISSLAKMPEIDKKIDEYYNKI